MASEVEIANLALTLLGDSRIISLDDDVKPAREVKAVFSLVRDSLLGGYTWSFAKSRAQLSVDGTAPAFGFGYKYTLPVDCLRLIQVGDHFMGLDLTDYRGSPTEEFTIEGRSILTDLGAPLNIKYVKKITDPNLFPPSFVTAFAAKLAVFVAEALTQSNTKQKIAQDRFDIEMALAINSNAIELPPQKMADDEWIMSRL